MLRTSSRARTRRRSARNSTSRLSPADGEARLSLHSGRIRLQELCVYSSYCSCTHICFSAGLRCLMRTRRLQRLRGIPIGRTSMCLVMITATAMHTAIITMTVAFHEAIATPMTMRQPIISSAAPRSMNHRQIMIKTPSISTTMARSS